MWPEGREDMSQVVCLIYAASHMGRAAQLSIRDRHDREERGLLGVMLRCPSPALLPHDFIRI